MLKNKKIKYIMFTLLVFLSNTALVFADDKVQLANEYIMCGDNSIPAPIAPITRMVVLLLELAVPLLIIVLGSLDFLKAVVAADQDKIKKTQNQFFTRLKAGAIFFFVVLVVKFAVSLVADASEGQSISNCIDCLINDEAKCGPITTDSPFLSDK